MRSVAVVALVRYKESCFIVTCKKQIYVQRNAFWFCVSKYILHEIKKKFSYKRKPRVFVVNWWLLFLRGHTQRYIQNATTLLNKVSTL